MVVLTSGSVLLCGLSILSCARAASLYETQQTGGLLQGDGYDSPTSTSVGSVSSASGSYPSDSYGQKTEPGADTYGGSKDTSVGYPQKNSAYGKKVCRSEPMTVFEDHCEAYNDRICRTFHQESCVDVQDKNCRAIVTAKQVRKCFNVTELLCSLKEDVEYEVVQVGSAVQKCHKMTERVCDTVHETEISLRDNYQCRTLPKTECINEEKTIYDKTCKTFTSFDCKAPEIGYGPNDQGMNDTYGSSGSSDDNAYGQPGSPSYDAPKPVCRRTQDTKCYKSPRTVNTQKCTNTNKKVCEKMQEQVPIAQERQNCHNEDKRVCELQQKTVPKQVKKFIYTKQCRSVPRQMCANSDVKSLVPSCVGSMRKQCHFTPIEKCEDVPKRHCFKIPRVIMKQKCEIIYSEPREPTYGSESTPDSPEYN